MNKIQKSTEENSSDNNIKDIFKKMISDKHAIQDYIHKKRNFKRI